MLSVVCYHFLGSDLLPEMDEGGFILDYYTPPGSSLAESNRILQHIEQILSETPEVENTSRRTGLQLGLAAVTEANRGDFTVRLKQKRDRGIDEIIEEVRAKIKQSEPAADVEFVQVLQDMIGDLTSAPEPVVIKMFSQDPQLLLKSAPRVADAIGKVPGVVDVLDGIENTISGPAVTFQVDSAVASRAGFTPEEIADRCFCDSGRRARSDACGAERSRLSDSRAFSCGKPLVARSHDQHAAGQLHRTNRHAGFAGDHLDRSGPNGNPSRKSAAAHRSDGAPGRSGPGAGRCRRAEGGQRSASAFHDPHRIRRRVPGTTKIVP